METKIAYIKFLLFHWGHDRDRMAVGSTTTCAISAVCQLLAAGW